jgi:hypothetical protein
MSHAAAELLTSVVCARSDPGIRVWVADVIERARDGQPEAFYAAYTAASRKAGRDRLATGWFVEDALRAALLLSLADLIAAEDFFVIAIECYERGDAREQQSWLKALPLLPDPERFLNIAIDACRTNIAPQFEAIACENPYPARVFPELNFNQMVLKAMFNGVALSRITGLETRRNAELTRMALDYAAERRAAGRAVPADLPLALTPDALAEEPR